MVKFLVLLITLISFSANAAYNPGTYLLDSAGNGITSTAVSSKRGIDANILNFPSVFGRSWNLSGSSDSVQVSNFPSVLGRNWSLSSTTDSVNVGNFPTSFQISNLPATTTVVQGTGSNLHTVVDSGSIAVSSSALPANAAIESGGHLASIDAKLPSLGQQLGSSSLPVVLPAAQLATLTPPTSISVSNLPATQTVAGTVAVSNLPATQPVSGTVAVSSLPAIPAGSNSIGSVSVSNFPATQPISGSVAVSNLPSTQAVSGTVAVSGTPNVAVTSSALPSGAASASNQTTEIGYLTTIAANTGAQNTDVTTTGSISALNGAVSITAQGVYTTTFSITGTWVATLVVEGQTPDSSWTQLPINIVSSSLPYQQTSTITTNGTYSITGGGFTNIRVRASAYTSGTVAAAIDGSLSQQTVIANINTPDLAVTGAAAQTALVNNILTSTSGTASTFVGGLHSATVQVTSTGTAGTFIFEGSNDNVNFQTIPVYNQLILTGTPITAAITASASQLVYTFPVQVNFIRLRIATAITGGSIQAFSRFSQAPWSPTVTQIANATAANANVQATIASGTVTTVSTVSSVTSDNLAIPGIIADVASAALTTTTTTATLTPTNGVSYVVQIPVTVVSGTSPTLDVEVQESDDTGTNWYAVYDFPRITAVGAYRSPPLLLRGNRIRYVQTVGGTTPSFTRAINRLQSSNPMSGPLMQLIDRTVTLTTLASTTPFLLTHGAKNLMMTINIGAATTAPALQLACSDDAGVTTYKVGTPLTAVASSTVSYTLPNMDCQQVQATVTTAGSAVTAGYVLLRAF